MSPHFPASNPSLHRLVRALGLKCTLGEYGVPTGDIRKIAELAVSDKDDPIVGKVVKILEDLY